MIRSQGAAEGRTIDSTGRARAASRTLAIAFLFTSACAHKCPRSGGFRTLTNARGYMVGSVDDTRNAPPPDPLSVKLNMEGTGAQCKVKDSNGRELLKDAPGSYVRLDLAGVYSSSQVNQVVFNFHQDLADLAFAPNSAPCFVSAVLSNGDKDLAITVKVPSATCAFTYYLTKQSPGCPIRITVKPL